MNKRKKMKVKFHYICSQCDKVHVDDYDSLTRFAVDWVRRGNKSNPNNEDYTIYLYDQSAVHKAYHNKEDRDE